MYEFVLITYIWYDGWWFDIDICVYFISITMWFWNRLVKLSKNMFFFYNNHDYWKHLKSNFSRFEGSLCFRYRKLPSADKTKWNETNEACPSDLQCRISSCWYWKRSVSMRMVANDNSMKVPFRFFRWFSTGHTMTAIRMHILTFVSFRNNRYW